MTSACVSETVAVSALALLLQNCQTTSGVVFALFGASYSAFALHLRREVGCILDPEVKLLDS